MAKILDYINLLRVRQWYKNLVIFLPIFFVGALLQIDKLYIIFIGFLSLCLISSANYVINDLVDLKKDQLHPEKKTRPLVLGVIKKSKAITIAIFLYAASLATAYWLNWWFFLTIIGLMLITLLYTFFLKNIIIFDILTIATLFVIRAVSGTFLINAKVSPWLVLCPFFLSLFMSVGKRHSELMLLKDHAAETRKVLEEYNNGLTNSLMIISTTLLIISYALYSFLSEHKYLLITLPFAIFVIFRFFFLTNKGSEIARQPEKIIKDRYMVIGIIIWILITTLIIYLPLPIKY